MVQYEHLPTYPEAFKSLIYCETIVKIFTLSQIHPWLRSSESRTLGPEAVYPIVKGQLSLFELIPSHKSLFHAGGHRGLDIGNYQQIVTIYFLWD
jgi:hypothetical protein